MVSIGIRHTKIKLKIQVPKLGYFSANSGLSANNIHKLISLL